MLRSRVGFAAVGCVLAAGLLMSGGAVAVAVPGLGGSSPNGDDGTNDSVQGAPTAGGLVGNVTDTVRQTIQGVTGSPGSAAQPGQQPSTGPTSTLGSGRRPGQRPSTATAGPETQAGGTATEDQELAGLVPAHPNPVAAIPSVVAPVTDAVAPVTDAVAPVTDVLAPVFDVIAPGQFMRVYQPGTAMKIPAGATLIFQMHYTPTGKPTTDRTRVGVKYAKSRPQTEVRFASLVNGGLHLPAGLFIRLLPGNLLLLSGALGSISLSTLGGIALR